MTAIYESLLLKLVTILELTQQSESAPQAKQALVHATADFRETLKQAKEQASTLPGGELSVGEQDEVIDMLQTLRERKREHLLKFSADVASMSAASAAEGVNMEVDSTASTPS